MIHNPRQHPQTSNPMIHPLVYKNTISHTRLTASIPAITVAVSIVPPSEFHTFIAVIVRGRRIAQIQCIMQRFRNIELLIQVFHGNPQGGF